MRIIKFRGKRCDDGEWVYGYYARLRNEFKDYLQQMITECEEKHKKLKEDLGYSGYMYSIPDSADAMFKLFKRMIDSCEFILSNLENVNLSSVEYYEKNERR